LPRAYHAKFEVLRSGVVFWFSFAKSLSRKI